MGIKVAICCALLTALVSRRVYIIMNREIPSNLDEPHLVRWLDEIGRVADAVLHYSHLVGIELSSWPVVKSLASIFFGLLLGNAGSGHKDSYYNYLENFASRAKMQIIAVEYRKTPHHPFPASFIDCVSVLHNILKDPGKYQVAADKIVIAGDGAGGNLAAAVSQELAGKVLMQILINPALQIMDFKTPSYLDNTDVLPGISSPERSVRNWMMYANMTDFAHLPLVLENYHVLQNVRNSEFGNYVKTEKYLPKYHEVTKRSSIPSTRSNYLVSKPFVDLVTDNRFSPMMAKTIKSIPNAYIITAQYDVLRDEAIMYTHRLFDDNIKTKLKHYKNAFHGFFLFSAVGPFQFRVSKEAMEDLVNFLDFHIHSIKG
ncbi:hypothetical protein CHS0354_026994 [Potamilus streckersoni]|uniref:Alpha/beta hydrolase fold-3 domain-containing protein n=1 Tax=Potamilus streckersoni TaxID=2493646 RepID=A0AAE0VTD0_9BIVA|nr:hypothetical protein CHS0354_026994 [Potamilus streckersoni]